MDIPQLKRWLTKPPWTINEKGEKVVHADLSMEIFDPETKMTIAKKGVKMDDTLLAALFVNIVTKTQPIDMYCGDTLNVGYTLSNLNPEGECEIRFTINAIPTEDFKEIFEWMGKEHEKKELPKAVPILHKWWEFWK